MKNFDITFLFVLIIGVVFLVSVVKTNAKIDNNTDDVKALNTKNIGLTG